MTLDIFYDLDAGRWGYSLEATDSGTLAACPGDPDPNDAGVMRLAREALARCPVDGAVVQLASGPVELDAAELGEVRP